MKKLVYSFLKDAKLALNNLYFYIEVGMAVIFVMIMMFVVPETITPSQTLYGFLDLPEPLNQLVALEMGNPEDDVHLVLDYEALVAALEDDRSGIGVYGYLNAADELTIRYILQGYEGANIQNIIKATLESGYAEAMGLLDLDVETLVLHPQARTLNIRSNLLPIYLTLNASFMALFVISSFIFIDKDEGTIRAFTVTPATIGQYLLSKMLIMLCVGTITSMIVVIPIVGSGPHYPLLLFLIMTSNFFGSALGLLVTGFANTMEKAMGLMFFLVIMFGLSSVSYFNPSFSPAFIRFLPTYPLMFAYRNALLGEGDLMQVVVTAFGFLVAGLITYGLATLNFKRSITV